MVGHFSTPITPESGSFLHADSHVFPLEAVVPLGDRFHLLSKVAPTCGDPEVEEAYRRQLEDVEAFVGRMKEEGVFSHDVPTVWIVHIIDSLTYAAWTVVADGRVAPRASYPAERFRSEDPVNEIPVSSAGAKGLRMNDFKGRHFGGEIVLWAPRSVA